MLRKVLLQFGTLVQIDWKMEKMKKDEDCQEILGKKKRLE